MGDHGSRAAANAGERRAFSRALLRDVDLLERMLAEGRFETGIRRMGVEQEMFLVDGACRPAPIATELLDALRDPRLTTELARFNLEANLPPHELSGDFLRAVHRELDEIVTKVHNAAAARGASVLLAGILPTLRPRDLELTNMTPIARYRALNDALLEMRGGAFSVFIRGIDSLETTADSVMLEAANTSLQLHLQVDPAEFARRYNLAQLISAPLLAAAATSPLLFGRRLWHETRVALFERSVDSRSRGELARHVPTRVTFGDQWVEHSPLELFQDNVTRFRPLLVCDTRPAEADGAPRLDALSLHNGTVWRWNRPCYGVSGGKPHLRIENRVLPAGPTLVDEVANAALFYGLVEELFEAGVDPVARLPFEDAKHNLIAAARDGLDAQLRWLDGRLLPTRELLRRELIPAARRGLDRLGVPASDAEEYLGAVQRRVEQGRTGARWMLHCFALQRRKSSAEASARIVTAALLRLQRKAAGPVCDWPEPWVHADDLEEAQTVEDVMTTDLFTVRAEDAIELAGHIMRWKNIAQLPVESTQGEPLGLLCRSVVDRSAPDQPASRAMVTDVPTVAPDLSLPEARKSLAESRHGCLLVVADGQLVGLITPSDLRAENAVTARGSGTSHE